MKSELDFPDWGKVTFWGGGSMENFRTGPIRVILSSPPAFEAEAVI